MLFDPAGFSAYAIDAVLLLAAWAVLGFVIALIYVQAGRLVDRRLREEMEMRELLGLIGRERREAHLAGMIANADAMAREVQDARAMRRIIRDVRRAPVLVERDIDRLPEVG